MSQDEEQGAGLLGAVVRFWWLVVAGALLAALIGWVLSAQRPELFQASATVLLADQRSEGLLADAAPGDPSRYVRNQARFAVSEPVRTRAAELLGEPGVALDVSAEAVLDVDTLVLSAVTGEPEQAVRTADALALAYEQVRAERAAAAAAAAIAELQQAQQEVQAQLVAVQDSLAAQADSPVVLAERDAATQQLQVLATRQRQLSVDTALFGGGVALREPAVAPVEPFQPRPGRAAAAGAVLGAALSSALAWFLHARRPPSAGRRRVESALGAPMLGEVPRFSRDMRPFPAAIDPLSVEAEAFQFLSVALLREARRRGHRLLLVTSAAPGDGKTATVVNTAVIATRDGHDVVLVDADVRTRGLTAATSATPQVALEELARPGVRLEQCLASSPLEGLEDLRVAATADADEAVEHPAQVLRSPEFAAALRLVSDAVELVLVDCPPVLAVADAVELAPVVDGVLVVITPWTSDDQLEEVRRRLDLAGAPIIGYVVNRSSSRDRSAYGTPYGSAAAASAAPGDSEPDGDDDAAAVATWADEDAPTPAETEPAEPSGPSRPVA